MDKGLIKPEFLIEYFDGIQKGDFSEEPVLGVSRLLDSMLDRHLFPFL